LLLALGIENEGPFSKNFISNVVKLLVSCFICYLWDFGMVIPSPFFLPEGEYATGPGEKLWLRG